MEPPLHPTHRDRMKGAGGGRQERGADEEEKTTRAGSRGASISRGSLAQILAENDEEVGGENSFPIIR